ncbi:hypothetical protein NT6N_14720 [Oceaniferula spumae]|uniref:Peptidylprolyl isomerase n=1 Tax=Oceaniferula spumae TaxID=2979115 RepID=A0AAT9FKG0_9BACT
MKNTLLTATAGIALGFAAAWFIKPTTEQADASTAEAPRPASRASTVANTSPEEKSRSLTRSGVTIQSATSMDDLDPETKKAMAEGQQRQSEMMRKRFSDQFDMKIAAMVKDLGLNAEQEKALREFYAEQLKKIDLSDMASFGTDPDKMKEMAAAIRGDGLNDFMKSHLSEDQMEGLEAYQERKKKSKIESAALKDLAKLQQNLDLSQEQKDDVYGILMEDAEKRMDAQSDADYVARAMMSSYGMEMDLGDMDMGSVISLASPDNGGNIDQATVIQQMKENRQKQIDEKVQRLSPVLNETQQAQYRKSLENKGGMLNMMLQGVEVEGKTE